MRIHHKYSLLLLRDLKVYEGSFEFLKPWKMAFLTAMQYSETTDLGAIRLS